MCILLDLENKIWNIKTTKRRYWKWKVCYSQNTHPPTIKFTTEPKPTHHPPTVKIITEPDLALPIKTTYSLQNHNLTSPIKITIATQSQNRAKTPTHPPSKSQYQPNLTILLSNFISTLRAPHLSKPPLQFNNYDLTKFEGDLGAKI